MGLGKRVGGKPAEIVAAELQARTAEQLFRVLGELKGGAMKFGQALSIFEAALPEEMAGPYRATLTKLQDSRSPAAGLDRPQGAGRASSGRGGGGSFVEFDDAPGGRRLDRPGPPRQSGGTAARSRSRSSTRAPATPCSPTSTRSPAWRGVAAGWIPGHRHQADPRRAQGAGWPRSSTTASRPRSQEKFAKAFDGDPDFAVPHVVPAAST